MTQVNMLEAKSTLSTLVKRLESGLEDRVVIARNGIPVAQLTLVEPAPESQRIGIAKGMRLVPDDWDINEYDDEIADMLGVM